MERPVAFPHFTIPLSIRPALVTFAANLLLVFFVILSAGGDPLELARVGTFYSQSEPQGSQGYDGQFVYYIARELDPRIVQTSLDVPAYRYQRILLPLAANLLSLGDDGVIPWLLPLIVLFFHFAGTWIVGELLAQWGVNPWYALTYGLWVGFSLSIRLDLPEPVAFALVAGAMLAWERKKYYICYILFGLSLFAKEVTVLFLIAVMLTAILQRRWRDLIGLGFISLLPFGVFQIWLMKVFGQAGIGSGGAMATSFELIPLMGLLRIWLASPTYGLAMMVVFIPAVVVPSIWGILVSLRKLIVRDTNVVVFALLLNALAIPFLPFSTFREPGGLLRFACGLVLALLLFAARYRLVRILRYSQLWIILNVFLVKS